MIRTTLLPVAAAALLAGCVTSGYSYREDRGGGYYYGTPSVEYRDVTPYPYDAYGPYGYYYGPYGPYRYAYPTPYGYRYYGYYGYGPGYPYYVPRYYVPRTPTRTVDRTPDRPRSPWRDLDEVRRQRAQLPPVSLPPPPSQVPSVTPRTSSGGSSMSEGIERARRRAKPIP